MTAVAPNLPIWAQWFAALAVPIAAVLGVGLGILNYHLAAKKRRDDLFNRRFDLYKRVMDFYYAPDERNESPLEQEERAFQIHNMQHEGLFLFGEDIKAHLAVLARRVQEGGNDVLDGHDPSAPFVSYLTLSK